MFSKLINLVSNKAPADLPDDPRVTNMRYELDYLQLEVSRLRSLVRYMAGESMNNFPITQQTRDSFSFQWSDCPDGNWIETRPELKQREPKLVCEYTRLPRDWFEGKTVLDAGCGSGRFSWAMASMGANVIAVDQSSSGVEHTRNACAPFGDRVRVFQHDLTKPLELDRQVDLVWSFGVLHHTGDTYGAFKNISKLVAPGGFLFLMLYGEPAGKDAGEYVYYAEVERLRRLTSAMSFSERYRYLSELKGADVGGWFDAVLSFPRNFVFQG
jgi:2-polyprenyl-3-methyl-5-hydroxy-6-metoxy-1,4-benzoquinol methylase